MSDKPEIPQKPKFLSSTVTDPEERKKPDDMTWGDWTLKPGKPLSARHRELARLAFMGKSQAEICQILDYTQARVSVLLTNSQIRAEIERLQNVAFERTVGERLKDMGPAAMSVIEEALLDDTNGMKMKDRAAIAQWVAEKLDGKAIQKTETADATLGRFLDIIAGMQQRGETLDVTPAPVGEAALTVSPNNIPKSTEDIPETPQGVSSLSRWVDENL